jgi:hypothetical protein
MARNCGGENDIREPEATSFDASAPGPWPNSFRLMGYKHHLMPRGQIDVSAARAISRGKVNKIGKNLYIAHYLGCYGI